LGSPSDLNSATTARNAENTDGVRDRSSSLNMRPGSEICTGISVAVRPDTVTSAACPTASPIAGNIASPRPLSAEIRMDRPRADIATGGSTIAVSHRVYRPGYS